MLKKLLKYDLRAIFKYWWILAISSVGLSIIGGMCLYALTNFIDTDPNALMIMVAVLGIVATVIGLSAFLIVTEILIFVRFYKNFFTDEGYLTFTLPVKRSQLLNSKLIVTVAASLATILMLIVDVVIVFAIGSPDFFNAEIWRSIGWIFGEVAQALGAYAIVYAIEIVLIGIFVALSSILLLYICITLASIIVKKAKVVAAIGIYYGAYTAVSFAAQLIYIFGMMFLSGTFANIPETAMMGAASLILLVLLMFVAVLCVSLYLLEYYLLDKKLNLA
ncbi:MAG: hypothetical protein IJV87_05315 [Clostridia bacterium]|nr:hypothetical protein [Clostridia bacterium]